MARDHGGSFGEALLFDAFGSLSWEFVVENLFSDMSVRLPGLESGELGLFLSVWKVDF